MKPSDITTAIAAGNRDVDSIANTLGVHRSNELLHSYLKYLTAAGAITRTYSGVRNPDFGPVYHFDLHNA